MYTHCDVVRSWLGYLLQEKTPTILMRKGRRHFGGGWSPYIRGLHYTFTLTIILPFYYSTVILLTFFYDTTILLYHILLLLYFSNIQFDDYTIRVYYYTFILLCYVIVPLHSYALLFPAHHVTSPSRNPKRRLCHNFVIGFNRVPIVTRRLGLGFWAIGLASLAIWGFAVCNLRSGPSGTCAPHSEGMFMRMMRFLPHSEALVAATLHGDRDLVEALLQAKAGTLGPTADFTELVSLAFATTALGVCGS